MVYYGYKSKLRVFLSVLITNVSEEKKLKKTIDKRIIRGRENKMLFF